MMCGYFALQKHGANVAQNTARTWRKIEGDGSMAKSKKKPRGKPFVSDDPRSGPRFGENREAKLARGAGSTEFDSAILQVMGQTKAQDVGSYEKNARELLETAPARFFEEYRKITAAEDDELEVCPHCKKNLSEPVEEDLGTKRAIEECEKFLAKLEAEHGGNNLAGHGANDGQSN
jgi:hypothetical protein